MDKQQLERMHKHNLKVMKVLFIVSMALFAVMTGAMIGFILVFNSPRDVVLLKDLLGEQFTLSSLFFDLTDTCFAAGLVCLLFSLLIFRRRARFAKALYDDYDRIYAEQSKGWDTKPSGAPIVDVMPAPEKPKGKYDDLIHEYEKLYEKGYITKEELDKKKAELQA